MSSFKVHILAADESFYEGKCESLVVPTSNGQYGIWANHANTISAIVPGEMLYRLPGGQEQRAAVSSGMVKIENNEVLVLVDSAERPEEIDANRAKRAADAAREALLQKQGFREYHEAKVTLARAIARLRVKGDANQKIHNNKG